MGIFSNNIPEKMVGEARARNRLLKVLVSTLEE
jgi:hypothetical protein